jgi:DNA-directed RNA polymerase II subunit RPB2
MDDLFDDDDQFEEEEQDIYDDGGDEDISQQDAWIVISKYFKSKGLVNQQLDSFDEFVSHTIQELIEDSGELSVESENQFRGDASREVRFAL